jgi:hypothetical protein
MGWDCIAVLVGLWLAVETLIEIVDSPIMPDDYDDRP